MILHTEQGSKTNIFTFYFEILNANNTRKTSKQVCMLTLPAISILQQQWIHYFVKHITFFFSQSKYIQFCKFPSRKQPISTFMTVGIGLTAKQIQENTKMQERNQEFITMHGTKLNIFWKRLLKRENTEMYLGKRKKKKKRNKIYTYNPS